MVYPCECTSVRTVADCDVTVVVDLVATVLMRQVSLQLATFFILRTPTGY